MATVQRKGGQRKRAAKSSPGRSAISKEQKKTRTLITAALPYANGPLHLGHMLEYVQADIYARFLRLVGQDVLYICASDMHGTPIEVNAAKAGMDAETFVNKYWLEHQEDFKRYGIQFDNYYKTHSRENKDLSIQFFDTLKKKGLIYIKPMNIIYCSYCNRSLPDRFVKGTCPNCTASDQYGDICERCSRALKGVDLLNPKCVLCLKTPIIKESKHYFFKLGKFTAKLKSWMDSQKSAVQPEVKNWLQEWMAQGLDDWCISRDAPYFGFEIPHSLKETGSTKYFYVWLDAPIGYISSTQNYCAQLSKSKSKFKVSNPKNNNKACTWEDYWKRGQVQHFIGKDISYFHFLFWPAMLIACGIPLPKLTVHGFITVDGQKMSKSRNTFITAGDFAKQYPTEALRFYYASHLDRKVVDVDINFKEFVALHNNVLAGNVGNFCYRVLSFAKKHYEALSEASEEKELTATVQKLYLEVRNQYAAQNFKAAVKLILQVADIGNAYFQKSEPWKDPKLHQRQVFYAANMVRNISILITPLLPQCAATVQKAFGEHDLQWDSLCFTWKGRLQTIDHVVDKLEYAPNTQQQQFPLRMQVGEIKDVRSHPHADGLYLLKVQIGDETKQVVAGLRRHFAVQDLMNQKAVFCTNIIPAKIRGEKSQAMILVANDGTTLSLLHVPRALAGDVVQFEGMSASENAISFEEFKKLRMEIKGQKVWFDGRKLAASVEDITAHVKDGGIVE